MLGNRLPHFCDGASILRVWSVTLETNIAEETAHSWAGGLVIEISAD